VVKNILKYFRRTKDVFLVYGGEEELTVTGYTDASFQTNKEDSKSQLGFEWWCCKLEKFQAGYVSLFYNGSRVHCSFRSCQGRCLDEEVPH
jgi:hypothetical protein